MLTTSYIFTPSFGRQQSRTACGSGEAPANKRDLQDRSRDLCTKLFHGQARELARGPANIAEQGSRTGLRRGGSSRAGRAVSGKAAAERCADKDNGGGVCSEWSDGALQQGGERGR